MLPNWRISNRFGRSFRAFNETQEDVPSVLVVIDGCKKAEIYLNRKGYFSINTEIVVDANFSINDIVARWPGSKNDQSIFNVSQLKIHGESGEFRHGVLLGDSGYCLIAAFIKTRLAVERTIGI